MSNENSEPAFTGAAAAWFLDEPVPEHLPIELMFELLHWVRAYQRAVDLMDEAATDHLGINRSDGRCLDLLEESGPMSAGELAEKAGLSPAAITALVDRLERAGYVERRRDTGDRRRVVVEMTKAAQDATIQLYGPLAAGFEWLRKRSAEQIELLRDFMRMGTELNAENAVRVRELPPLANSRRRTARSSAPSPEPTT
jgi:DNA-binding MarR family transcriptional regulator